MYEQRVNVQVQKNRFREWFEAAEMLNKVVADKGMTPFEVWAPSVGTVNSACLVSRYESLSAWQLDGDRFQHDAEAMAAWRKLGELEDGFPTVELWESATQIA